MVAGVVGYVLNKSAGRWKGARQTRMGGSLHEPLLLPLLPLKLAVVPAAVPASAPVVAAPAPAILLGAACETPPEARG